MIFSHWCHIKKNQPVRFIPRHVLHIATIYAQLAAMVDKSLNAFSLINTSMLRMTNCSEQGINAQSAVGLAQCSRNLRKKREALAEVQESVQILEAKLGPDQLTLDNCDTRGHHSTVAYTQVELEDTSHLSIEAPLPEDVMALFNVDILNLSRPELEPELAHFKYVAMLAMGRYLAERKEELTHWQHLLPVHHKHPNSHQPLQEAHVRLESLLHYQVRVLHIHSLIFSISFLHHYLACP